MEATKKKLPVGIENFEEIRTEDFYYVDKTGMIKELLVNWGKVNLFTRPRRFGKSLNMSMLKSFFEIGCSKELFAGLEISKEKELCEKYMGQFPVVSISLKGAEADTFAGACSMITRIINEEAGRLQFLMDSSQLTAYDKEIFASLLKDDLEESALGYSLRSLSMLLRKHYGKKVIILVDEYDVPLAKANENGYYDQMVMLIRKLFEQALKTNDNLYFAVLTGCLRVAKESIFTGLNNPKILSVTSVRYDEYFGFTDREVCKMLEYYGVSDAYDTVKQWYDGYRFGNVHVYCPWDVLSYVDELQSEPEAFPKEYWSNTSGNDVIRHFLEMAKPVTRREIEALIAGEAVTKVVKEELTYKELYDSIENVWSVLLTTGYLTQKERIDNRRFQLVIPNKEIQNIFMNQIMEWIQDEAKKDGEFLETFCDAFRNGDAEKVQEKFARFLENTISIRDTAVRKDLKENLPGGKATTKGLKRPNPSVCFYHGVLLGLLSYKDTWYVASNRESGDGYSDILAEINEEKIGIVVEIKYAEGGNLEESCSDALEQIERRRYAAQLYADGMNTILKYGIACRGKECKVMRGKESMV